VIIVRSRVIFDSDLDRRNTTQTDRRHRHSNADGVAIAIADLASAGRPDPPTLRAAATLLDGVWRFHTGHDPRWADVNTDDTGWKTIDLTAVPGSRDGDVGLPDYVGGWMAHGHPGYDGYAWYRRAMTVPAGRASWDILGPTLVVTRFTGPAMNQILPFRAAKGLLVAQVQPESDLRGDRVYKPRLT
jgi:hypothetical protein